ncbi:MAG: sigma-70 family RNA polymerase sigma factor [Balneolaceae bacterium]|nr:sigma-70 family RNA polymerase sigma factor [Balneolaceae bacterium]
MTELSVTSLLKKAGRGEQEAYQKVLPKIYDQLRSLAYNNLANEYHEHTYSKTELVHEAYLKICKYDRIEWQDRTHFYAIASKCMRQILIDYARKKMADKRGGKQQDLTYIDNMVRQEKEASNLLDLDAALQKLESFDPRLAEVVEYRYFGEMSIEDTAEVMDISVSTVKRDWAKARGWLYKKLNNQP